MVMLGDSVCQRFYLFVSLPYRLVAAFLSGFLISTWFTYLGAVLFARASHPLLWSNLLFFAIAIGFILWSKQSSPKEQPLKTVSPMLKANKWDWVLIVLFLVFAGGLLFSNFDKTAEVKITNQQSNDFVSNSSIIQRLATEYNLPPDSPFYAGGLVRPYFLFWFQAGNLEHLGLNLASSINTTLKDNTYILNKGSTQEQAAVPDSANPALPPETIAPPEANVFKGGKGNQPGQFEFPHGMAVDSAGNIFIADTGNGRIQKFSAEGDYLATFGQGICKSPKGIVVDADNIFVGDIVTNRILKFKADDFSLLQEWTEKNEGLYGPADIAIGADKNLYVADQGRARIVKFTPNGEFLGAWGIKGAGDGEFNELTGITIDEQQRIYVADARNARIQIFDANGKFLSKFQVAEWSLQQNGWQAPDVLYDKQTQRLYVSSSYTHEILVFETDGKRLEKLTPSPPDKLNGPTSLVVGKNRRLFVLNTISSHVSAIDFGKK